MTDPLHDEPLGGEEFAALLAELLADLPADLPIDFDDGDRQRVHSIVHANLRSGRWRKVIHGMVGMVSEDVLPTAQELRRYLAVVKRTYVQERDRLHLLQAADGDAWAELLHSLQRVTRSAMARRGLASAVIDDHSDSLASDAVQRIYTSFYPCDVSFEAWCFTIVKNVIRTWLRDEGRETPSDDEQLADALLGQREHRQLEALSQTPPVPVPGTVDHLAHITNRDMLIKLLARIGAQDRQKVLIMTYFWEWSVEEIARALARTSAAVYTLRHRALEELRSLYAAEFGCRG